MTLQEELRAITGRKKRFFLLRIIDVGAEAARQLTGISKGTYNSWLQNDAFVALYRRREELAVTYKQEALQLLRRDNQLQAILLEEKIIGKMQTELETGNYELIKTNLAREVYSKLINDLDYQPSSVALTWVEKLAQIFQTGQVAQIPGGITDGEFHEADSQSETEQTQSRPVEESQPSPDEAPAEGTEESQ